MMDPNLMNQTTELSSDENNDEDILFGEKYSGSDYSSNSSSTNPPPKRKRITSENISNSPFLFKVYNENIPILMNEIQNKFEKLLYFESSSDESEEDNFENIKLSLPRMPITWGPVTGKNLKLFRYPIDIKISIPVYHNYLLKTPYDFFKLLFNNEIIDHIVNETNRYAKQCKENMKMQINPLDNWYDTNRIEMEAFIGILMFMILTLLPSEKSYWDGMQEELFRSKVMTKMTRDRFKIIMKMWHFSNNEIKSDDRMKKLTPVISLLEKNFQDVISPGEKLYIDESVIPFRRGLKAKYRYQFGLRCISLCLSNGYAYKLLVYFGRDLELKKTLPSSIITTLMNGLLNEGRILFTKEHYTSVNLAHKLLKNNTHLLGPLNSKRKFNPKSVIKYKLQKGKSIALESNTGVVIQKWKNIWNRDILVLSTKYTDEMIISFCKNGKMSEQPKSIYEITKCTSSLDCESFNKLLQQMEEYHVRLSRRMKWYRRIAIEFLIQKALINAYILHQRVTNDTMDILDFRKQVTNGLLTLD